MSIRPLQSAGAPRAVTPASTLVNVSAGFAAARTKAEADGVLTMPDVSSLRRAALRDMEKPGDRVSRAKAYAAAFKDLKGEPKNKAANTFLEAIRQEFASRVEGEELAAAVSTFLGAHADRLPKSLAGIHTDEANEFRVNAANQMGKNMRPIFIDVPFSGAVEPAELMKFLDAQPELKDVAPKLKASAWGGLQLWVRSTLDKDVLGWSTESIPDAFRQVQTAKSQGGAKIVGSELSDIIQALSMNNITNPRDGGMNPAQREEFASQYGKALAAGAVREDAQNDYLELKDLYHLPE